MLLDLSLWAISALSQNRLHRTAPTDYDMIWDTRCDDTSICMSIYGLYGWCNENIGKSCLRGKFFLSGFWCIFWEFVKPKIESFNWTFHCDQTSDHDHDTTATIPDGRCHNQQPVKTRTCGGVGERKMLSSPPAASLESLAPHSRLSLALPFSSLTTRSYPKMACCQGEWNNQVPNTPVDCSSESRLSWNLAYTYCQKPSLYYQKRWSRPGGLPLPSQSHDKPTLL